MKKLLITLALVLIPSFAHADITTGLLHYWDFDENTGTTADDQGSGNLDGTLAGTTLPSWTSSGYIGSAIDFSTDATARVSLGSSVTLGGTFTIAMWWKANVSNAVMMAHGATNNSQKFGCCVTSGKFFTRILNGGAGTQLVNTPTTGSFHFVVLSRDSSDNVYISVDNGADQALTDINPETGNYIIDAIGNNGNVAPNPSQNFEGVLDEVRIYNRKLSADDQTELYEYTGSAPPSVIERIIDWLMFFD